MDKTVISRLLLIPLLIVFILLFMTSNKEKQVYNDLFVDITPVEDVLAKYSSIPEAEKSALIFVINEMSGAHLSVYTNYLDWPSNDIHVAAGHDVLSESQGLFLLYFVNRGMKCYFDLCLQWTINKLSLKNKTYSWVKKSDSEAIKVNAFIDDLRIIKALFLAHDRWGEDYYLSIAEENAAALLEYNTVGNKPVDFYDLNYNNRSDSITLSYLNLYSIGRMSLFNPAWEEMYINSHELLTEAKIKGTGLYAFQYDINTGQYYTGADICLIQSVYAMLHLAYSGFYDMEGIDWIWEQYSKYGKVYTAYTNNTYKPATSLESTALYAITARLFYLAGEKERAEKILSECEKFQVNNKQSNIFGSFGFESNMEVYSFDVLQYLLTSSMIYAEENSD